MSLFHKAERTQTYLKLAISGPAGSGKTMGALRLARGLVGPSGRIAVIDTENGSASLYALTDECPDGVTEFDALDIEDKDDLHAYAAAIKDAEESGYDCVIIDSASHIWEAVLEAKDQIDRRNPRSNSFTNWKEATRQFKDVLDPILFGRIDVICCLRTKQDWVLEKDDKGRQVPKKIGLAPVMREGIDYEFTTFFEVGLDHQSQASKDRTRLFDAKVFTLTEDTGAQIAKWRASGKSPSGASPAIQGPASRAAAPATPAASKPAVGPAGPAKPASPGDVVIHFGKNKGTRLRDLKPASVEWYAYDWETKGDPSDEDRRLRKAAIDYLDELAASAPADDDNVKY